MALHQKFEEEDIARKQAEDKSSREAAMALQQKFEEEDIARKQAEDKSSREAAMALQQKIDNVENVVRTRSAKKKLNLAIE